MLLSGLKECKKCGRNLPATTEYFYRRIDNGKEKLKNICIECTSKQFANRYAQKGDKIKERNRQRYAENPKPILSSQRDYYHNRGGWEVKQVYYESKIEEIAAKKKQYRLANKLKTKIRSHSYYHERGGKELSRQYKENNKEKIREGYRRYYHSHGHDKIICIVNRRRTNKLSLPSTFRPEQWLSCKDFFDHSCAYCGKKSKRLTEDHVISVSGGGAYIVSNIIPACKSCNSSKHVNDMRFWYCRQPFFSEERLSKILAYIDLHRAKEAVSL